MKKLYTVLVNWWFGPKKTEEHLKNYMNAFSEDPNFHDTGAFKEEVPHDCLAGLDPEEKTEVLKDMTEVKEEKLIHFDPDNPYVFKSYYLTNWDLAAPTVFDVPKKVTKTKPKKKVNKPAKKNVKKTNRKRH